MAKLPEVTTAIIGGSGLCQFPELEVSAIVKPKTKYGLPSDNILICEYGGTNVAFLPRHAKTHTIAPHLIPYRANIAALKHLGIKRIIGTCICGSLKDSIKPGHFVTPDQFVNLTWGRDIDLDPNSPIMHIPMANPFCENLRESICKAVNARSIPLHSCGTSVVIQGPRFSTLAESQWFVSNNWDLVNMTLYPECYYAREAGICYASLAMITDFDPSVISTHQMTPQSMDKILEVFRQNIRLVKEVIFELLESTQTQLVDNCRCAEMVVEYYKQALDT